MTSSRWAQLLLEHPGPSQALGGYAKNREWRRAHMRHGEVLGLSLEELREFAKWLTTSEASTTGAGVQVAQVDEGLVVTAKGQRVKTLDELLTVAGVDLNAWQVSTWAANSWEVAAKDADGEMTVTPVYQVKAKLEARKFNQSAAVQPVAPIKRKPAQPKPGRLLTCLVVPDSQHGHKWTPSLHLEPLHSRKACDLVIQVIDLLEKEGGLDCVSLLGDMADLAEWSTRFPRDPAYRQTTQPTIRELHWWFAQMRLTTDARIVYSAGNHEARVRKAAIEKLPPAVNLHRADLPLGSPDALSFHRLLALDALDIEYVGPYTSDWWLWDKVRVTHGHTVKSGGGATVANRVKLGDYSEIFGHVHTLEGAQRTTRGPAGPEVITAMSPGCLCRIDGTIPGRTVSPDWQQGLGVITYDTETGAVHMTAHPIIDGRMMWRGQVLEGVDRTEEIGRAIGFPQLVPE